MEEVEFWFSLGQGANAPKVGKDGLIFCFRIGYPQASIMRSIKNTYSVGQCDQHKSHQGTSWPPWCKQQTPSGKSPSLLGMIEEGPEKREVLATM